MNHLTALLSVLLWHNTRILNWLYYGKIAAEFVDSQSSFVKHMMGIPVFLAFGLIIGAEMLFGSSLAPLVVMLAAVGLSVGYKRNLDRAFTAASTTKKGA
jgi:hypothetical protein